MAQARAVARGTGRAREIRHQYPLALRPYRQQRATPCRRGHRGGARQHQATDVRVASPRRARARLRALTRRRPAPTRVLGRLTLEANGDRLEVSHVPPAHTDTDVTVRFVHANVLHAGDVFFNGRYPYIDGNTGGRVDGMIEASNRLLHEAEADTRIVPGHGPLATRADLVKYRDMLSTAADRVGKLKASGKSLEESIAAKPLTDLDGDWGSGRYKGDDFVRIVYLTL